MSFVRKIARDQSFDLTIILVGSRCCGAKSALLIRYLGGKFIEEICPTIEDTYAAEVSVDGRILKVLFIGSLFFFFF